MKTNTNQKYDFVIVGAGFAGASCARLLTDKGYKCLIIEERPFVSGNAVSLFMDGMEVHPVGAHILHTNDQEVWNFLNRNGAIRNYYPESKMFNSGNLFSFPPNLASLREIYDTIWPNDCKNALEDDKVIVDIISNVEEYCLANYGKKIYKGFYKDYIEKKFGIPCSQLSIENLDFKDKIEFVENSNLYKEKFQGIPVHGYKEYVEYMLGDDIDVMLNVNFLDNKEKYMNYAPYTIYTGEIDRFFNYCIGNLDWRNVMSDLDDVSATSKNYFGIPILYFSNTNIAWYRATENKWLDVEGNKYNDKNYITYEVAQEWKRGLDGSFPIISGKSLALYDRYVKKLHATYPNVILCGRKAKYNHASICEVIREAIDLTDKFKYKD